MIQDYAEVVKWTSLKEAVYQTVGHASVCWSEAPGGIFDDKQASEAAEKLLDYVTNSMLLRLFKTIDVVFDGPPGHESGRFVEVEIDSKSVNVGEWVKRPDGFWALRLPVLQQK